MEHTQLVSIGLVANLKELSPSGYPAIGIISKKISSVFSDSRATARDKS